MTSLDRRLPPGFLEEALRADARTGLTLAAEPKSLPPKWFYDAQGSALFDKITELPEYYPTRAEREILRANAAEIAAQTGARTLIELGSGSSDKTRLLLDALRDAGTLRCYVPVDVSEPALAAAGKALSAEYPGLDVRAVVSDFEERLGFPRADGEAPAPRLVAFLGSTIGNLEPGQRAAFLARVRAELRPGDFFLLGTDLVKDPATLVAAYDDEAGVTAEFNKNVLAVLNAELGADFDLDAFEHVAVWNADAEWIEMRLRSCMAQTVRAARASGSPSSSPTARRCAPRCRPSSAAREWRANWPRPGSRCARGGPTRRISSACPCRSHGLSQGAVEKGDRGAGDGLAGLIHGEAAHVEEHDERLPADHERAAIRPAVPAWPRRGGSGGMLERTPVARDCRDLHQIRGRYPWRTGAAWRSGLGYAPRAEASVPARR